MLTFPGAVRTHNTSGAIATSHMVASHITKLLISFRKILQFRFRENPQGVVKTKPFLSTCKGDPSATEAPPVLLTCWTLSS